MKMITVKCPSCGAVSEVKIGIFGKKEFKCICGVKSGISENTISTCDVHGTGKQIIDNAKAPTFSLDNAFGAVATKSPYEVNVDETIRDEIMNNFFPNRKITAIKYYVDKAHVSLAEAKSIVESFGDWSINPEAVDSSLEAQLASERYTDAPDSPSTASANSHFATKAELNEYILKHFDASSKISAVKFYRDCTHVSLAQAKDAVDKLIK